MQNISRSRLPIEGYASSNAIYNNINQRLRSRPSIGAIDRENQFFDRQLAIDRGLRSRNEIIRSAAFDEACIAPDRESRSGKNRQILYYAQIIGLAAVAILIHYFNAYLISCLWLGPYYLIISLDCLCIVEIVQQLMLYNIALA